jgi:hypothetical protein
MPHRCRDVAPAGPTMLMRAADAPATDAHAGSSPDADGTVGDRLKTAGLEVDESRQFLDELKTLVEKNDRAGVCKLANYPPTVPLEVSKTKITNEGSCVTANERIFTRG